MCGRGEKIVRDFGGKAVGKETTQKTEDRIRRGGGIVEWIQLAQVRGRWRAVVNTVMNLQVLVPPC
jgi:hypothetical protein